MNDFGLRSQKDAKFHEQYEEEMEKFKKRILEDNTFFEKFGELGPVYGKSGALGKQPKVNLLIN